MSSQSSGSADSVLDEIRSTIASFESLRSAASARRRQEPVVAAGAQGTVAALREAVEQSLANTAASSASVAVSGRDAEHTAGVAVSSTGVLDGYSVKSHGTGYESPTARLNAPVASPIRAAYGRTLSETFPPRESPIFGYSRGPMITGPTPGSALRPTTSPVQSSEDDSEDDDFDGTVDTSESLKSSETASAKMPKTAGTSHVSTRSIDKTAKIMIVDDEPLNVMTFRQHLKMEGYEHFVTTSNSREALHLLRSELPDVLLLDIRMPDVSGMDILRVIGLDPVLQHIPVLILTAASDPATRNEALELGASDFLQKPIAPEELLPRVRNAIVIKKHYDMASSEAARLEQQVERRTRQLEATRQQLILCLARAAEHRDNDTGNHVIRVGRYTSIIARRMGYPEHKLDMLEQAAQLHDVGKIGVPDSILFKPGKLAHDEYELMKKHCALGKQIIEPISEKDWNILKTHTRIGESMLHVRSSSLLMLAARIAQTHHEHWNGRGYPLGLQGEDIPLEGRIVAVADVFDALSSRRPYKDPFPRQKCFDILGEGRGTQFDPAVIDAFFECAEEIIQVQLLLMDEEDRIPKSEWEAVAADAVTNAGRTQ